MDLEKIIIYKYQVCKFELLSVPDRIYANILSLSQDTDIQRLLRMKTT